MDTHIILQGLHEADLTEAEPDQLALGLHEEVIGIGALLHQVVEPVQFRTDLLFAIVLAHRDLDRRVERLIGEGLHHEAIGLCDLGLAQGVVVRVGGQEDHRQVQFLPDLFCGLHAAVAVQQVDIHDDDIGPELMGLFQRIGARPRESDHFMSLRLQSLSDIPADDGLILDDQHTYGFLAHVPE